MNTMPWEKHDNEMRNQLSGSEDFLPDQEHWRRDAAWQRLSSALDQPASVEIDNARPGSLPQYSRRRMAILWIKWAVAASVVSVLFALLWWNANFGEEPVIALSEPETGSGKSYTRPVDESLNKKVVSTEAAHNSSKELALRNYPAGLKSLLKRNEVKALLPTDSGNTYLIANAGLNGMKVANERSENQSNSDKPVQGEVSSLDIQPAIVQVPDGGKTRPRVVHLNELGLQAPSPPGFDRKLMRSLTPDMVSASPPDGNFGKIRSAIRLDPFSN